MGAREVFEVLYSPIKTFKKIVEKPDFKGVLLIFVLVMLSVMAEHYVFASKFFPETRTPDDENWTESMSLWDSNGSLSLDDSDKEVGNYSVRSFVSNGTSIYMNIINIGPFDFLEDAACKGLFFRIKWIHGSRSFPSNATLRLFSENESSYFELDLTGLISTSSGEWNNATVALGPESQGWDLTDSDWRNITGLEFKQMWLTSANLTMKIDDLYFREYVSFLETHAFSGAVIIDVLMWAAVAFSMNWILWSLILIMVAKVFREEVGPWTVFFVIIGHAFSIAIVYAIASAVLFSVLPTLNLPLDVNAADALMQERWYPHWSFQLWYYLLPFVYYIYAPSPLLFLLGIWTMALCTIAIHSLLRDVTWGRAASICVVALIMRSILRFFFPLF